ncbi:hypothetical protein NBRC116492_31150 [Aurantivibrio infirmus]
MVCSYSSILIFNDGISCVRISLKVGDASDVFLDWLDFTTLSLVEVIEYIVPVEDYFANGRGLKVARYCTRLLI